MRRFLLGVLIGIITLGFLLGGCLLLAKEDKEEAAAPTVETLPAVTEAPTLPPETKAAETIPPETEALPAAEPEKAGYDAVPQYYQTDYPYIKFGNGTMATSGCSVTCLAMMATYLTDQEYTPVQMAYHFGRFGKTNIERLDYGISQMQLPYQRTENVQDVLQGLRSGKAAIVMMDEESVFTNEQHFIVLAGINEAGKIVVRDPFEPNYTKGEVYLKAAYEDGFEDYHISQGFSGGWIFDKDEMPSEPFLFDASMPEQKENRYEGYMLTGEDIYTLACFVWAEAKDEPPQVQQAVAEVVLNRLMHPKYPNTVRDVIYKSELSRAVKTMAKWGEENYDPYIAVDTAMYGPYVLPEDICFYSIWEKGDEFWGQLGSYSFYKDR